MTELSGKNDFTPLKWYVVQVIRLDVALDPCHLSRVGYFGTQCSTVLHMVFRFRQPYMPIRTTHGFQIQAAIHAN
jgi:hypothetical protein